MKLLLYQLQYAVSESEYTAIQSKEKAITDLPISSLAAILTKELDIGNQATPHIGEYINDSYWPRDFCEQKVVNVCYSYSDNTCTVTLEPFVMVVGSNSHSELANIASLHGWNCQMA